MQRCANAPEVECFQIAETFKGKGDRLWQDGLLLEFVQTATKNDAVIKGDEGRFASIR